MIQTLETLFGKKHKSNFEYYFFLHKLPKVMKVKVRITWLILAIHGTEYFSQITFSPAEKNYKRFARFILPKGRKKSLTLHHGRQFLPGL